MTQTFTVTDIMKNASHQVKRDIAEIVTHHEKYSTSVDGCSCEGFSFKGVCYGHQYLLWYQAYLVNDLHMQLKLKDKQLIQARETIAIQKERYAQLKSLTL